MKKAIINCLTWYASSIAQTVQYESWSDEFCRKENKKYTDVFTKELKQYIDFNNITIEEAIELRFVRWEDNIYLIPLYLVPILPVGTELTCINGEKIIYNGDNIELDIRFGCIAYGIEINKEEMNNDTSN